MRAKHKLKFLLFTAMAVVLTGSAMPSYILKANELHDQIHANAPVYEPEKLMSLKELIEEKDEEGRTPLILAASEDNEEWVKALVECGADVSATDSDGFTPIMIAAAKGNFNIVHILILMEKSDINRCEARTKMAPLHLAAFSYSELYKSMDLAKTRELAENYLKIITELLNKDTSSVNYIILRGFTPISLIADRKVHSNFEINNVLSAFDDRIIDELIKHGGNVNFGNVSKDTNQEMMLPIYCAAHQNNTSLLKKLIDYGADINIFDLENRNAFTAAVTYDHEEIFNILLEQPNVDYTVATKSVLIAPSNDDIRLKYLEKISNKGIKISEIRDTLGNSALHWAAADCGRKTIDALVKTYEAKINVQNANGQTPLHTAVIYCNAESVDALIDNGADVIIRDSVQQTPLDLTYTLKYEGPDLDKLIKSLTLIRESLRTAQENKEHDDKVKAMKARRDAKQNKGKRKVDAPAKPSSVCKEEDKAVKVNETERPLPPSSVSISIHTAVEQCDMEKVKECLQKGAGINTLNDDGQTPICLAIMYGHTELVSWLLENGADVNLLNGDAKLPIEVAIEHNNKFSKLIPGEFYSDTFFRQTIDQLGMDPKCKKIILEKLEKVSKVDSKSKRKGRSKSKPVCTHDREFYEKLLPGNKYIIRELLTKGANIVKDDKHLLFCTENPKVAEMIASKIKKESCGPLMFDAICENNVVAFDALSCKKGVAIGKLQDENGNTLLHVAAMNGSDKMVRKLLQIKGIAVNQLNLQGDTPLSLAVKNNKLPVIKVLLDHMTQKRITFNLKDLLSLPCSDEVKELLTNSVSTTQSTRQKKSKTSVTKSKPATQGEVLPTEDDKDSQPVASSTPLIQAEQETDVVPYEGMHLQAVVPCAKDDAAKDVPAHEKSMPSEKPVIDSTSIQIKNRIIDIFGAIYNQDIGTIQDMIKYIPTVNFNIYDDKGDTPLTAAIKTQNNEMVDILLSQTNVDVNARDGEGNAPLHIAVNLDCAIILEKLLGKTKIDVNAVNSQGDTPLHVAVKCKRYFFINNMLRKNTQVDVNLRNANGKTPLHYAAQNADVMLINRLFNFAGIQVNLTDRDSKTPVQCLPEETLELSEAISRSKNLLQSKGAVKV